MRRQLAALVLAALLASLAITCERVPGVKRSGPAAPAEASGTTCPTGLSGVKCAAFLILAATVR